MSSRLPDPVRWILNIQSLVVAIGALASWSVFGHPTATAVALGGLVGMVGSWAYAWRAWRRPKVEPTNTGAVDPHQAGLLVASAAYRAQLAGEAWRLAATALAFVAIFAGPVRDGMPALPVMLGFGLAHVAYWIAFLRQQDQRSAESSAE